LRITVAPTGAAESAVVFSDPGYGFAEVARGCSLAHQYVLAQDEDRNAIAGTMKLRIHFSR
jgi:hypothetical protein